MSQYAAVLVDRDGVINVNRPDYVKCWDEFEFLPGALQGLAMLAESGFTIVVVTNQSVVNRGLVSLAELGEIHSRMCAAIRRHGGRIHGVLYCPHRPEQRCPCRKPQPGLLLRAKHQLRLDWETAVLIGDHHTDLEAASRAGCRSILVRSGRPTKAVPTGLPDGCIAVVPDLLAAAQQVVVGCGQQPPLRSRRLRAAPTGWTTEHRRDLTVARA